MIERKETRNRPLYLWAAGLFALIAALVGIAVLSAAAFQQAVGDDGQRTRAGELYAQSNATILAAAAVYDALQDAERGQRGYVITGNRIFLEPYEEKVSVVEDQIDTLERLVAEDGISDARIDSLRTISQLKLDEMAGVVAKVEAGDLAGAQADIATGYGRRLMQQISEVIEEIRLTEERQLGERREAITASEEETSRSIERLATFGTALLVAAILSVIALAALLARTYRSAARERMIETENEALELAVAARTRELTLANERLIAEAQSRETAEDRLRQAQRLDAVGQLTGGIAHDFNNMLSVIIGSLDLLRRRMDDDPKLQRLIDNALEGADRAATLTARLLAFSRQQSLKPEVTDLNKLLEGTLEFLQRTLGETVQIEMDLDEDIPDVFIDASELENVVINLGANARDAMPKGGKLTIATKRKRLDQERSDEQGGVLYPGSYAELTVADTGEGMPPEVLAKVYEPFFTTKPVGKGTGLGLSQVHGFVIQSGGMIDIDSERGEGTTIRILLPEGGYREEVASLDAGSLSSLPEAKNGEVILVVEDQAQLRALTTEVLEQLGYEVHSAGSGREALELLTDGVAPSLLFTDIVMPEQTGEELARVARAADPDLKILYTSGFTQAAGVEAATLDPAGELLRKPYTVDQLATAVRRVIDS